MPSDLGKTLKSLGLALLNATLLLLALVLLLAVLLVWQLRGLAGDIRTGLRADLAAMQTQLTEAREGARAALDALPVGEEGRAARQDLAQVIARLDALDTAADPAGADALFRRLVLAIIATAAREVMPGEGMAP